MHPSYHPSYYRLKYNRQKYRDKVFQVLATYLQKFTPNGKVLEIGGGFCSFINAISSQEKSVVESGEHIKEYANGDVKVFVQQYNKLDNFKTNYFDAIFVSNAFEYLEKIQFEEMVAEIKRVLKADGTFIAVLPDQKALGDAYFDDYRRNLVFTSASFIDVLQSNDFYVVLNKPKLLPEEFTSFIFSSAFLTKLYFASPIRPFSRNMLIVAINKKSTIQEYLES